MRGGETQGHTTEPARHIYSHTGHSNRHTVPVTVAHARLPPVPCSTARSAHRSRAATGRAPLDVRWLVRVPGPTRDAGWASVPVLFC